MRSHQLRYCHADADSEPTYEADEIKLMEITFLFLLANFLFFMIQLNQELSVLLAYSLLNIANGLLLVSR